MRNLVYAAAPILLLGFALALPRIRREAYELAADAELIVGSFKRTFSCEGLKYGYYADVDNGCQIFHVCVPHQFPDGSSKIEQFSFMCGNQTIFNQFSHTCAEPREAIPCEMAKDFFYLNERYGVQTEQFHRDEDVASYNNAIARAYGSRYGKKK